MSKRRTRIRVGRANLRMKWALAVVLVVMLVLAGRIVQIQGLDAPTLAAAALKQRLSTQTLHAGRGDILTSDGTALAQNVTRYTLVVDQTQVGEYYKGDKKVGAEGAAADIAKALHTTKAAILPSLQGDRRWNVIVKGLSTEAWRRVQDLGIPGIAAEPHYRRSYPDGAVAGNLVGFVGSDGTPLAGMELEYNKLLSGKNGFKQYERGRDGSVIPLGEQNTKQPVDGTSLNLTINSDIQYFAQQQIAAQVKKMDAEWGTVVVMRPTGEILALADSPGVDPNNPGASPANARGSRALSDVFEPGSVAKVITAAGLLQEHKVTPYTHFTIPGLYTTPNGEKFKDAEQHGTEQLTFAGILAKSSNIGVVKAGSRLTKKQRYDYLRKFGIGQSTGIQFPGTSSGILHKANQWDGRTQYAVLFGQGLAATSVQTASAFATLANDGVRAQPRLLQSTTAPDGTTTENTPAPATRAISSSNAKKVIRMMAGVVQDGTGTAAQVPGYQVAGKTGTAQAPAENGNGYDGYTASFIGMAPANNPQLVVAVTLQRPKNNIYGGPTAGPVFAKTMSFALGQCKIPPAKTKVKPYPETWERGND
ncbi:peptidoglycan D,D-transpeptidase FtsI family protein [Spelaeicoccus albus]|uniref:Cell division protein FtsI (Penicillin-binding protein 3) n=1 Tax=Spelaeicoccus albus TaxID=1280376 RepID=A0A7Z0D504_9MICO|nr:penicillin-binding protein 2 [Spelaeicoccus albus]NYI68996.1 cell division protein FtsI (penicillin-binding protein 3) [Spelaeicoccus albus]